MSGKIKIAIPVGDPAGIGPEIALKAALDPAVRAACEPILVCDPRPARAPCQGVRASRPTCANINILACPQPETASLPLRRRQPDQRPRLDRVLRRRGQGRDGGRGRCGGGRAAARDLDRAGRHRVRRPSVVRRAADRHRRERRLHDAVLRRHADRALHPAPERARGDRADHARERGAHDPRDRRGAASGSASPTRRSPSAASTRTPAKADLFGREEIEIIKPAMDQVSAEGISVAGPFGADTMFHMPGFDAFVVMLHDQGHIADQAARARTPPRR